MALLIVGLLNFVVGFVLGVYKTALKLVPGSEIKLSPRLGLIQGIFIVITGVWVIWTGPSDYVVFILIIGMMSFLVGWIFACFITRIMWVVILAIVGTK